MMENQALLEAEKRLIHSKEARYLLILLLLYKIKMMTRRSFKVKRKSMMSCAHKIHLTMTFSIVANSERTKQHTQNVRKQGQDTAKHRDS